MYNYIYSTVLTPHYRTTSCYFHCVQLPAVPTTVRREGELQYWDNTPKIIHLEIISMIVHFVNDI